MRSKPSGPDPFEPGEVLLTRDGVRAPLVPLLFAANYLAQHVLGLTRHRVGYYLLVILGPGTVLLLALIARLTTLGLIGRPCGGVGAEALKIAGGA